VTCRHAAERDTRVITLDGQVDESVDGIPRSWRSQAVSRRRNWITFGPGLRGMDLPARAATTQFAI